MTRNAPAGGRGCGQRVTAKLRVAEDRVHAESKHVGREDGMEEQREKHPLRDLFGHAGADREEGSGESARREQADQQGQQEIADQEKARCGRCANECSPIAACSAA